jgi:hypothetical protein
MRNGGWRDALQYHDLTAIPVNLRGDNLKNHQLRFVGWRLGNPFRHAHDPQGNRQPGSGAALHG